MAVEITQGPGNWSISGAVGAPKHHARFTCTHPPLNASKHLKFKLTQTEGSDYHGELEDHNWISPDENGEEIILWFGVGSYTLQLLEINKDANSGVETVAAVSNIVSFEVTA